MRAWVIVALVALSGCVSVEWTDGQGQTIKATSPGAVCATWEPGEGFLLSADPRSDFGTNRMFGWLANIAGSVFGASQVDLEDRATPHDTCAFLFDHQQGEDGTVPST